MALWQHGILIFASAWLMEALAWWVHKHIMHGWGWGWHRDHHEPHHGLFEVNDLYAVVFGIITAALFILGLTWWPPLWSIGAGFTLYGLIYAFVHDGLVHQRLPIHWFPKRGYWKRLVQAHKLHHATTCKEGAVSFGFVIAPDPQKLRVRLRELRQKRQAAGSL